MMPGKWKNNTKQNKNVVRQKKYKISQKYKKKVSHRMTNTNVQQSHRESSSQPCDMTTCGKAEQHKKRYL